MGKSTCTFTGMPNSEPHGNVRSMNGVAELCALPGFCDESYVPARGAGGA